MSKRIVSVFSIVLYAVAGLLAVYCTWSLVHCTGVISQAMESGQLSASRNEYDIISFYMSNCAQYVVFALLLGASGVVLQKGATAKDVAETPVAEANVSESDDELDDWFAGGGSQADCQA